MQPAIRFPSRKQVRTALRKEMLEGQLDVESLVKQLVEYAFTYQDSYKAMTILWNAQPMIEAARAGHTKRVLTYIQDLQP